MRVHEAAQRLAGVEGRLLWSIADRERQAEMDTVLERVQGWKVEEVTCGRRASADYPHGLTNVHVVFTDGGGERFALGFRARDVHEIGRMELETEGLRVLWVEVWFKRGHRVRVGLV